MHIKIQLIKTGLVWLLLLGFMGLSQPSSLPVIFFVVPFALLFVALIRTWTLFWALKYRLLREEGVLQTHKRLGFTLSITGVLLLVLQSLGQLTVRDVVTLGAIMLLAYLYIGRTQAEPERR